MVINDGDVITTKSSVLEIFEDKGELFIKKIALPPGENDVKAQVQMITSLPDNLSEHYPKLISWEINKRPFWYIMPFYNFPSFLHCQSRLS